VCCQKRKATEATAAKNDGYDQFVDYSDQFVDNFLRYAADVQLPAAIRTCPEKDTLVRLSFRFHTRQNHQR
jgi:hypothetical protein